jgi:hypothetical protein
VADRRPRPDTRRGHRRTSSHGRPTPGVLRPVRLRRATGGWPRSSSTPTATAMAPYTAHRICPVMKLPGSTLMPCRNQMVPIRQPTRAARLKTILVTCSGRASRSRHAVPLGPCPTVKRDVLSFSATNRRARRCRPTGERSTPYRLEAAMNPKALVRLPLDCAGRRCHS